MKHNQAFTLIELLVVVLIIGLLSAVALPQYEKAVEKSKSAQAFATLNYVVKMVQSYYLANGKFPSQFSELGLDLPSYINTIPWTTYGARDTISSTEWSLQLYGTEDDRFYVTMGRISGPYAGAAFGWTNYNSFFDVTGFICMERKELGIVFSKKNGSYCKNIINAQDEKQLLNGSSSFRLYPM